jgi:hypothetical protein
MQEHLHNAAFSWLATQVIASFKPCTNGIKGRVAKFLAFTPR